MQIVLIKRFVVFVGLIVALTSVTVGQLNDKSLTKIRFLIMPINENDQKRKTTFTIGEKLLINALVKNNTGQVFRPTIINQYYTYQFDLTAIGNKRSKAFRRDKIRSISANAMEPAFLTRLLGNPIGNGRTEIIETLDLADWYENIEPGEYKLTVLYRPNESKMSFFSNSVSIKIVQ